jgi:hypothetical protein
MSATTQGVGRLSADSRFAALAEQIRSVRSRASFSASNRWMLYVGGTLMPLGLLLIVLGWLGASRTPLVFEQTPYLISGGLLGVALVIGGGFVYFGYWQSVRIHESRRQNDELTAAVTRLETLLGAGSQAGGHATTRFVATPHGSIFHRPDCPVMAGRAELRQVDPDRDDGLAPCQICDPLADAG